MLSSAMIGVSFASLIGQQRMSRRAKTYVVPPSGGQRVMSHDRVELFQPFASSKLTPTAASAERTAKRIIRLLHGCARPASRPDRHDITFLQSFQDFIILIVGDADV